MHPSSPNFSALTIDLYEVTMACGYWKAGVSDQEAAFHVLFRENPFTGEFTVACGLATVVDLVREFRFMEDELAYLAAQRGNDGQPLFDAAFLKYLRNFRVTCDVDAVPEARSSSQMNRFCAFAGRSSNASSWKQLYSTF